MKAAVSPSHSKAFTTRRRDPATKRDAVLQTAAQLFLEKSYGRTSLNDVADRLNITKPALLPLLPQQGRDPAGVLPRGRRTDRRDSERYRGALRHGSGEGRGVRLRLCERDDGEFRPVRDAAG